MAVRGTIVGIDSPEALEKALRAAYYLADEALATAGVKVEASELIA